jgi:hypothetical protein
LFETEALASGISEDLISHRGKILSTRDKMLHTGGLLGRAHRTMRMMQSRDVQRKLCVYGAVAFVVFMFVAFVVHTLFPPGPAAIPEGATFSPTLSPDPKRQ